MTELWARNWVWCERGGGGQPRPARHDDPNRMPEWHIPPCPGPHHPILVDKYTPPPSGVPLHEQIDEYAKHNDYAATRAERHVQHYRACGCLGDSAECCDPKCCPPADVRPETCPHCGAWKAHTDTQCWDCSRYPDDVCPDCGAALVDDPIEGFPPHVTCPSCETHRAS